MQIAEGDEIAFSELFRFYYPRLLHFLGRFDQSSANVDEAIQETFIRVWMARDQLPSIDNFRAWLFTIASREAIALIRKHLLTQKTSEVFLKNQPSTGPETPADIAQTGEIRRLVEEAVARMPPARRRIYRMSREEGLKPAEIASRLNLSVNTVKNTLVTALHDIRKFLSAHGHTIIPLFATLLFNNFFKGE
ncbi:RNA polymerase sigma factor [Chitinophaga cymbidii]|uniref:DNA-directed RNA polymerase sigma-70 factor n=1 Tax=Chitinophaga cymbidii TaxID=1096750 RepID=A0A512RMF0_9BACT|nr:sigma-70 family RNA polymerase sigma factor [Chitinophaga cymbidii]GEP96875.1 DNA-directed RNA polymerase sigma-70 factor [Chitinophaga cymbidii]